MENFNHAVSLSHLILEDNTKEARNKVRNELDSIVKADPFMITVATRSTLHLKGQSNSQSNGHATAIVDMISEHFLRSGILCDMTFPGK